MGRSILSQDRDFRRGPWTCTHLFAKLDVCYSRHWYIFFASWFLALALLLMFGLPTCSTSLHQQSFLKPFHRKAFSPWLSWEPTIPSLALLHSTGGAPGFLMSLSNRETHTHHTHTSLRPPPMRCSCRWLTFPLICLHVGLGAEKSERGCCDFSKCGPLPSPIRTDWGQKWGPRPKVNSKQLRKNLPHTVF